MLSFKVSKSQTPSKMPSNPQALGDSSWPSTDKSCKVVVLSLTIIALVLRLAAFFLFREKGGDGPAHAILAYMWSISPSLRPHDAWLPGYIYLTGAFNLIVGDPLISTRILNLFFGTLTVPVFFLMIRRIFGHIPALLSATLLAVFPLHIALSVTSLGAVSFLFEIITGMLFVLYASVTLGSRKHFAIGFSILLFGLASLTRYEVWILLPLFPTYYFLKTGQFFQSLFLAIGLALFPIAWMVVSFNETGSFLLGYDAALLISESISLFGTLRMLARLSVHNLGYAILLLTAAGFLLLLADAVKRRLSKERLLYLAIVFITGLFWVKFGMDRGSTFDQRYLLFIFVMSLPIFSFVLSRFLRKNPYIIILAVVFIAAADPFISQAQHRRGEFHVTQKRVQGIEKFGHWLGNSPYRDSPLFLTTMKNWDATFLPLYRPEIAFRYSILTPNRPDSVHRDFIKTFQPQLLITREGDDKGISDFEKLTGALIRKDRLVYDIDTIRAFDLNGLSLDKNYSTSSINRYVLVGPGYHIKKDIKIAQEPLPSPTPITSIDEDTSGEN